MLLGLRSSGCVVLSHCAPPITLWQYTCELMLTCAGTGVSLLGSGFAKSTPSKCGCLSLAMIADGSGFENCGKERSVGLRKPTVVLEIESGAARGRCCSMM